MRSLGFAVILLAFGTFNISSVGHAGGREKSVLQTQAGETLFDAGLTLFGEKVSMTSEDPIHQSSLPAHQPRFGVVTLDGQTRLVPFEYSRIEILRTHVFVKKENDVLWSEVPISHEGNRWKVGKPIVTPYEKISFVEPVDVILLGVAETLQDFLYYGRYAHRDAEDGDTYDLFNTDGQISKTLHRLSKPPVFLSQSTLLLSLIDPGGNDVYGVADYQGNMVGPLLPTYQILQPDRGDKEANLIIAVALDSTEKSFLPLTPEGTLPVETRPVRGYRLLEGTDQNMLGLKDINRYPRIGFWVKEYGMAKDSEGEVNGQTETKEANQPPALLGWASPSTKIETGPLWTSLQVEEFAVPAAYRAELGQSDDFIVGHLLDGTWMAYEAQNEEMTDGSRASQLMPLFDKASADRLALTAALNARFASLSQHETQRRETYMTELNARLAREAAQQEKDAARFEQAFALKDWEAMGELGSALGGDYYVRYLIEASRSGRYAITPAHLFSAISYAQNKEVSKAARQRYQEMLEEQRFKEELQRKADAAATKAQQERQKQEERDKRSTRTSTAWIYNSTPSQPQMGWVERQNLVNQYYRDVDRFIHSNQTWIPTRPAGLN